LEVKRVPGKCVELGKSAVVFGWLQSGSSGEWFELRKCAVIGGELSNGSVLNRGRVCQLKGSCRNRVGCV